MSVLILEDNRQILKVLEELVLSVSDEKVMRQMMSAKRIK